MDRRLQCECGTVRGTLHQAESCTRLMCYCKDCRAFAHYLGKSAQLCDAQGGVDIVVANPANIEFTSGKEALACMSLSDKGMLRWYASCCNTAIGNTGRGRKMAYMGMSTACLQDQAASIDSAFGAPRMRSFTEHARAGVPSTGVKAVPVVLGFGVALLKARLNGSYLRNPFFTGDTEPLVKPTVLPPAEHQRLRALA
jgi:hypothetical protein